MTDMTETTDKTEEQKQAASEGAPEKLQGTEAGKTVHERSGKQGAAGDLPPLDFTSFILSLSTSVLMHLGVVENPVTKKTEKELPVARQTIDIIELLKEKTEGNLSEEETQLMVNVLRELRMLYVKAVQ